MEQVGNLTTALVQRDSSQSTALTNADESRQSFERYALEMKLIVGRSFALTSYIADPGVEQAKSIEWAEELYDIVPVERLGEVFKRAIRDHDSTFPIDFYDLKLAWFRIRDEEATAAYEAAMERRRRAVHHYDCGRCGGQRWVFEDGMKRPCEGE